MKTASIRELRNHMPRIAHWIEIGETVRITRRGESFALITAEAPPVRRKNFNDAFKKHATRLKKIWGNRKSISEARAQQLDSVAKGEF